MRSLRKYVIEQLERKVLSLEIFEMAMDRKNFIDRFGVYARQLCINYITNDLFFRKRDQYYIEDI